MNTLGNKMYDVILLCGGKGTRLRSLSKDVVPKPLFEVSRQELIQYSLDILTPGIVDRLIFAVDYKADDIRAWATARDLPYQIEFSEQTQTGVVEAILSAIEQSRKDRFIICCADEILDGIDLDEVVRFHESNDKLATLVAARRDNLSTHLAVKVGDRDGLVTETIKEPEKYAPHPEQAGLVCTGLMIIEREAAKYLDTRFSGEWADGITDPLCKNRQLRAFIDSDVKYFNVGTPEEATKAKKYLRTRPNELSEKPN